MFFYLVGWLSVRLSCLYKPVPANVSMIFLQCICIARNAELMLAMQSAVLARGILSVCPSRSGIVSTDE